MFENRAARGLLLRRGEKPALSKREAGRRGTGPLAPANVQIRPVAHFSCEFHGGRYHAARAIATFYLKQVAQTLIRDLNRTGVGEINNRVEVAGVMLTTAGKVTLMPQDPDEGTADWPASRGRALATAAIQRQERPDPAKARGLRWALPFPAGG